MPLQFRRQVVIRATHAGFSEGHSGLRKTVSQVRMRAGWVGWTMNVSPLPSMRECAGYHRCAAPEQRILTWSRVGEPEELMINQLDWSRTGGSWFASTIRSKSGLRVFVSN